MAKTRSSNTAANLGFEARLWAAADALRNNMDAAEYKHVVLGLIFLKYISDAFEARHAELEAQKAQGADPEDRDEYRAANIFWVPREARWSFLKASAPQPTIGALVDDAMAAIERDNPSLKAVLPKDYARPGLDKQRLGQSIGLIANVDLRQPSPQPSPSGRGSQDSGADSSRPYTSGTGIPEDNEPVSLPSTPGTGSLDARNQRPLPSSSGLPGGTPYPGVFLPPASGS